jgi:hypothetical protein
MFNGERLDRMFLMYGATKKALFSFPYIGVWFSASSKADLVRLDGCDYEDNYLLYIILPTFRRNIIFIFRVEE